MFPRSRTWRETDWHAGAISSGSQPWTTPVAAWGRRPPLRFRLSFLGLLSHAQSLCARWTFVQRKRLAGPMKNRILKRDCYTMPQ